MAARPLHLDGDTPDESSTPNAPASGRRATLLDVSREAGVAVSTVSAVLRQEKRCWASKTTRQRVIDAAEKVNYRPNQIARALRTQKLNLIGAIFSSLNAPPVLLAKLARVEDRAHERGHRMLIGNHHDDPQRLEQCVMDMLDHQVAGVILNTGAIAPDHAAQMMLTHRLPAVTIDSTKPSSTVSNVSTDREHGGYLQVRHLLEDVGCRRLVFMTPKVHGGLGGQKIAGFERALAEQGSTMQEHVLEWGEASLQSARGFDFGREAATRLLERGETFDGVVGISDAVALGAMQVLERAGRRVPEDVAVVGFDDQPFAASLSTPLTTIRQPLSVGEKAFEMLMRRIEADGEAPPEAPTEQAIVKPELIVRQSTRPKPDLRLGEGPDALHADDDPDLHQASGPA